MHKEQKAVQLYCKQASPVILDTFPLPGSGPRYMIRQWPKVYDLCSTFLHIVQVRKHTDMRELHAKRGKTCYKI